MRSVDHLSCLITIQSVCHAVAKPLAVIYDSEIGMNEYYSANWLMSQISILQRKKGGVSFVILFFFLLHIIRNQIT